jgi:Sec7 domain
VKCFSLTSHAACGIAFACGSKLCCVPVDARRSRGLPFLQRPEKRTVCAIQVKKKMTVDEFIKNNRGINDREDLPQDFLRDLYHSISRNEIRISSESQAFAAASPVLWAEIKLQSEGPRGQRLETLGLSNSPAFPRLFDE